MQTWPAFLAMVYCASSVPCHAMQLRCDVHMPVPEGRAEHDTLQLRAMLMRGYVM